MPFLRQSPDKPRSDELHGKEEPYPSCSGEHSQILFDKRLLMKQSTPAVEIQDTLSHDDFVALFEDVRVLKRGQMEFCRQGKAEMLTTIRDEIKKYVDEVVKPELQSEFMTLKKQKCSSEGNTTEQKASSFSEQQTVSPDMPAISEAIDKKVIVQSIGKPGCDESADSDTYRDLLSRLGRVEQMLQDATAARGMGSMTTRTSSFGTSLRVSRSLRSSHSGHVEQLPTYVDSVNFDMATMSEDGHPKLDAIVHELCAQAAIYDFSETMWDVMPFCGLGVLTLNDQCCVILIALVNVAIQGLFIGLMATIMLDNDFKDASIVTTLEKWRILYAHNPDYADEFTDEPLASSLCARSLFMMHGAAQASLYNDIDDYTKTFLGAPVGGILCLLSVFLWMLTCAEESKRMLWFFIGIWTPNNDSNKSLWHRRYTCSFVQILENPVIWIRGEARQKNYQIFITPFRALSLTVLVLTPRAMILISVAFVGTLFLVQTLQITDLILNAVALDVVMNVDELLFSLFCPPAARRLVYKALPLRVPRSKGTCKRVEAWLKLALVFTCLTAVGLVFLGPLTKTMKDVKSVMCDGDQEFLAVQLPFGPVAVAKTLKSAIPRGSYAYRAIYQKTRLAGKLDENRLLYLEGGAYALMGQFQVRQMKTWRDRSLKDVAELPPSDEHNMPCVGNSYASLHPASAVAMMAGAGSIIGNENMQSCDDVAHLCFNHTSLAGKVARFICAPKCGMSDTLDKWRDMSAISGLFLDTQEDGVPVSCRHQFSRSLSAIPCKDGNATQTGWKRYADGVAAHLSSVFKDWATYNGTFNRSHFQYLHNHLWDGMVANGCSFFAHSGHAQGMVFFKRWPFGGQGVNFCDPEEMRLQGRRSIRPLCPETCKCNSYVNDHFKAIIPLTHASVADHTQCPEKCFNLSLPAKRGGAGQAP